MWWAEALGKSENASGFYNEMFKDLWAVGKSYNSEIKGKWAVRSRERWIRHLVELQIIQRRREGRGGKVYYVFDPYFLSIINQTWRAVKKVLR